MTLHPSYRFLQKGPYIPFPKPVEPFDGLYYPDDRVTVCIPRQLMPYVIGACKALAQPETWYTSDDTDVSDMVIASTNLLTDLSNEMDGCLVQDTSHEWECDYDFLTSEAGWELWPTADGDRGEWVSGIGWRGTVGWESALGKYVRRLSIRRILPAAVLGRNIYMAWDHVIEGTTGDWYSRTFYSDWSHLSVLVKSVVIHNGTDSYYGQVYAPQRLGQMVDTLFFNGYAGYGDSPGDLDTSALVLKGYTMWGWGDDPEC